MKKPKISIKLSAHKEKNYWEVQVLGEFLGLCTLKFSLKTNKSQRCKIF